MPVSPPVRDVGASQDDFALPGAEGCNCRLADVTAHWRHGFTFPCLYDEPQADALAHGQQAQPRHGANCCRSPALDMAPKTGFINGLFIEMESGMNVCMAPWPVVFDLDGTLIDSAPDIHACVNSVLTQHDSPLLTLDQVRSFIGGGVDVLWQKIMAAQQLPQDCKADYVAAFMICYQDATQLTRLFPNVVDALGVLADRGHPLGICTNKPLAVTQAILAHLDIAHLFGCVIGGDSVAQRKPHPAPLQATLAGLGADPADPRAIYVGDSEFDAACASAVPVPFLIYSRGYRQTPIEQLPHLAQFDDFACLPGLVERHATA